MTARSWQETAQIAQHIREASITRVEPPIPRVPTELPLDVTKLPQALLTKDEIRITQTTAETLVASLASGRLNCDVVTRAFLRRAGLAQRLANCITELLPERALERARYLDEYYREHERPIGPLHGLPISVKEHIGMKDLGLNAGFVSWWDNKGTDDAHILRILWTAGCVFYARTTQPQTLMHLETSSNLYGETVNPFNRKLTSGGSSGGEGALVGLRGSCLGIGTDIGGSIRNPAGNCGVYGFRPTSYRLPTDGWTATMLGSEHVVPVIGPLSTSLDGIKLFMRTIIAARPWLVEPSLLPMPWREQQSYSNVSKRPIMKVAVLWSDEIVKPHPPVTRALVEVTEKLRKVDGVEIVDWKPYKHDEAWKIIASLYFCDGAKEESDAIDRSGEPWRPLSNFIIKENPYVKHLSIGDVWYWTSRRESYRRAYATAWNETATSKSDAGELEGMVDVILCPVTPGAAPPLDQSKYWGYTSQWNLLDYPALVFPVTKVNAEVDILEDNHKPFNAEDEFNHELYRRTDYVNAPVSLQLVGRRYEDEKVISALDFIKDKTGLPFAHYI